MRWISTILFLALILLAASLESCIPQPSPISSQDTQCGFDKSSVNWEQQDDCLAMKIPSFAGYGIQNCTIVVYLTSPDDESIARAVLEPLLKETPRGMEYCSGGTNIEFRKARYTWVQLREWQKRAFDKIVGSFKGLIVTGIDVEKNAVFVILQTESYVKRGREILIQEGIPNDALLVGTGVKSERPPMGIIRDGELIIPAFISGDKQVGELVLGKTTLKEAEAMFPPAPPQARNEVMPRRPGGYPTAKVGKISPVPELVYNPWGTTYALYFDKNQIFVEIEELGSTFEGRALAELVEEYPALRKTESFDDVYEMQTEVTACSVLMVLLDAEFHEVLQAAYAYTCPTR